jgi:hypothetical protein
VHLGPYGWYHQDPSPPSPWQKSKPTHNNKVYHPQCIFNVPGLYPPKKLVRGTGEQTDENNREKKFVDTDGDESDLHWYTEAKKTDPQHRDKLEVLPPLACLPGPVTLARTLPPGAVGCQQQRLRNNWMPTLPHSPRTRTLLGLRTVKQTSQKTVSKVVPIDPEPSLGGECHVR